MFGGGKTRVDKSEVVIDTVTLCCLIDPYNIVVAAVILLRHRIGVTWVVLRGALQHGHRARVVARATIRCRRIVAIELATCRSGRTGGASGLAILGNFRRRELIGGAAGS